MPEKFSLPLRFEGSWIVVTKFNASITQIERSNHVTKVCLLCKLKFEHSRSQGHGSEFFCGSGFYEVVSWWFPAVFLTDGIFIVIHAGVEYATLAQ